MRSFSLKVNLNLLLIALMNLIVLSRVVVHQFYTTKALALQYLVAMVKNRTARAKKK